MIIYRFLFCCVATALLSGCPETERATASGEGTVRGLNASSSAPAVAFLIEERAIGLTGFKQQTETGTYDNLSYTANFDYQFVADNEPTRLASVPFDLADGTDYLFIFTGSLEQPATLVWEGPIREWDGTETVMEVRFGHLSPALGEVDLYLAAPGTEPMPGEALATLSNGNNSAVIEREAGEYQLTVTAAGDPGDVLFTSEPFDFAAAANFLITLFDPDPSITAPLSARVLFGGSSLSVELGDVNSPPTLRLYHTAFGTGPIDLYIDSDFTAPLIGNVAFGELSGETDAVPDTLPHTFTDAGNVGAVLLEEDLLIPAGSRSTRFFVGEPDDLLSILVIDNLRSLDDSTKLRLIHTAASQSVVDVYLVESGTDIEDAFPRIFDWFYLNNTGYFSVRPGTYDLYATTINTRDVLAGPVTFSIDLGDVVHYLMLDTADPNVTEFVEYDRANSLP